MRSFGMTADGRTVHSATIAWPGGLSVEVLEYGAVVRRLAFPAAGGARNAVLCLDALEDYERDTAYIGALVGRVANRISAGRFALAGREVQVDVNEPPNTLHGGRGGFNTRVWRFEDIAEDGRSLSLAYTSPNGEEGFPGALQVRASFSLIAPDTLQIDYAAQTDSATPVNLSHHLYFNLLGDRSATILDHRLSLAADAYTPVGQGLIPTGVVAPVAGTPMDLRQGARIADVLAQSHEQLALGGGLDLNWALSPGADPALRFTAPDGAWLEIATDQPGIQVYSGQRLSAPFVQYGALAVEPQGFPDAVNNPGFPASLLEPGRTYRRSSRYRLGG